MASGHCTVHDNEKIGIVVGELRERDNWYGLSTEDSCERVSISRIAGFCLHSFQYSTSPALILHDMPWSPADRCFLRHLELLDWIEKVELLECLELPAESGSG